MDMAACSALDLLVPELQRRILLQLESFDTLYAFILASPRIHQVFRLNRKAVLSKIARRRFSPAAIRDVLAIEKLREIENPPFSRDTLLLFFSEGFCGLDEYHHFILPLPLLNKLVKLDRTIGFFTNDYAQNTLPILAQLNHPERPAIATEYKDNCGTPQSAISRSESDRLRRAFCRFETYRQLFCRCSTNKNYDHNKCLFEHPPRLDAYEQAERFFQDSPAYQAVEIACVRDYLHRRMRGAFDLVEDEIVHRLQAECPNLRDEHRGLEWDYWTHEGRHQHFVSNEDYFGYSGKQVQNEHIEYLFSLGLPYVRTLLESAGDERHDLLLRKDNYCYVQEETDFITAALGLDSLTSSDRLYGWRVRHRDSCLDEETRLDVPPGWLWAHQDDGYYAGVVNDYDKGLRDWGYVFWDLERLQKAGVPDLE